jgi:hypothetical protein
MFAALKKGLDTTVNEAFLDPSKVVNFMNCFLEIRTLYSQKLN